MPFGYCRIKLRPIKFAFFVNPYDIESLLNIIRLNTFLWGGTYNPIIPILKRTPKAWYDKTSEVQGIKNIVAGYINAYDPDYVVEVTPCPYLQGVIGFRSRITIEHITQGLREYLAPSYGVGLFEILDYFIKSELKYVRQDPIEIINPSFKNRYHLFLASTFGELQSEINSIFENHYVKRINAKKVDCNISNYYTFLNPNTVFLRRLSSLYFQTLNTGYKKICIFYLNAANPFDVIDFWNLRALGWHIAPVPKQIANNDSIIDYLKNFVSSHLTPSEYTSPFGPNVFILKGREIDPTETKQFRDRYADKILNDVSNCTLTCQNYFPRIWDEWARGRDDAECCILEAESADFNITGDLNQIDSRLLTPDFIKYEGFGQSRFANEIEFHSYGNAKPIAEVIPEGDEKLTRLFQHSFTDKWRFSRRNVVYFATHLSVRLALRIPEAMDVFKNWLKLNKWNIELSPVGYIAAQIIENLQGIDGINYLASKEMIDLLSDMEEGKYKQYQEVWKSIRKHVKHLFPHWDSTKINEDAKSRLQDLIDLNIFETGIEIQCPICQQHSWFSLKDVMYSVGCPKCTKQFKFPVDPGKSTRWIYRTVGPFSLPKRAYGIYSNLLTLRFFSQLLMGATTPLIGFLVKKEPKDIEIDLGLFFKDSEFRHDETRLVFAECKTHCDFNREDVDKMKILAEKFPGAVLVFSTLKEKLASQETKLLRPFVKRCRKYLKGDSPRNLTLILTSTELYAYSKPPWCWREAGGEHAAFANTHEVPFSFNALCDKTQQKYLDLPPWHDEMIAHFRRRARSKTSKNLE